MVTSPQRSRSVILAVTALVAFAGCGRESTGNVMRGTDDAAQEDALVPSTDGAETAPRADGDAGELRDAPAGEVAPEAGDDAASADAADAMVDAGPCTDPLTFGDPILEGWVRRAARLPIGPVHRADAQNIVGLEMDGSMGHIQSLAGAQCLPSLVSLTIADGRAGITDLSPLSSLVDMERLITWHCAAPVDVRAIAGLTKLRILELESGCGISDVSPLYGMTKISWLDFEGNPISDVSQFLHFPVLSTLYMNGYPIDCDAQRASLDALRARNVTVLADCLAKP